MLIGEFWVDGADFVVYRSKSNDVSTLVPLAKVPFSENESQSLLAVFRESFPKPAVTEFQLTDRVSKAVVRGFYERHFADDILFFDGHSAIQGLEKLSFEGRWSYGLSQRVPDKSRVHLLSTICNAFRSGQREGPVEELLNKYFQSYLQ